MASVVWQPLTFHILIPSSETTWSRLSDFGDVNLYKLIIMSYLTNISCIAVKYNFSDYAFLTKKIMKMFSEISKAILTNNPT